MDRRANVLRKLLDYSEDEIIYRRYYELRGDDAARKALLAEVEDYAREHYLFLEEYPFIVIPKLFSENSILPHLGLSRESNVYLLKHNRYTPVFLHQQDFFEIVYAFSGSCNQRIGQQSVPLKQGDLCFIPPYVEHTMEVFDDSVMINLQIRRDTFDDIFFNSLRANSILSEFFMSCLYSQNPAQHIVFSTGDDQEIQNQILEMYEEMIYPDEYSRRLLSSMVPVLFVKTLRGYGNTARLGSSAQRSKTSQNALRLVAYINDNYKDVTLESMASHFNYSVPYCSKLIRDETGTGFVFFVRRVRMNRAATLLQSSNASVATIGEMVGYENPESFIRAFQKVYHQSPSAYRKSVTNDSSGK